MGRAVRPLAAGIVALYLAFAPNAQAERSASSSDLWDVTQGSFVINYSPVMDYDSSYWRSSADAMFGGSLTGSVEPKNTIFADSYPAGTVHWIEWMLPAPITLRSFNLFANHDPLSQQSYGRSISRFSLFAHNGSSWLSLYKEDLPAPYGEGSTGTYLSMERNVYPIQARRFAAEFVQRNDSSGASGPRIAELDGYDTFAGASHVLEVLVEPVSVTPGIPLKWTMNLTPSTASATADLYVGFVYPGGGPKNFLFFSRSLKVGTNPVPYQMGISVEKATSYVLDGFVVPSAFPEGDYLLGAVLTFPNSNPLDRGNWISNLAVTSARLSLISPAQQVYVNSRGKPKQFVKTFVYEGGRPRVDETWVFADNGPAAFFVNGTYMTETTVEAGAAIPTQYRPEYYHFDTTPEKIVSRHGQPLEIRAGPGGSGAFFETFQATTLYIYDGITFGFEGERLVFVIPAM